MWGKFCQSSFEITARTVLAQFGHFTLQTRVRFQKGGGGRPPTPPLGAPLVECVHIYITDKLFIRLFSPGIQELRNFSRQRCETH